MKSNVKSVLVWGAVAIAIVGSVVALAVSANTRPSSDEKKSSAVGSVPDVLSDDWVVGNNLARTTIIEYSDLQCPACRAYYPILKQLNVDYGSKLRIVYRYFPLAQIHQNSTIAAYAAQAAGLQGKFWEMHDILFENQSDWSVAKDPQEFFREYAKKIGLNAEQFSKDSVSTAVKERVARDEKQAIDARLSGTPTFYLNGKPIENPQGLEEFKKVIDASRQ